MTGLICSFYDGPLDGATYQGNTDELKWFHLSSSSEDGPTPSRRVHVYRLSRACVGTDLTQVRYTYCGCRSIKFASESPGALAS